MRNRILIVSTELIDTCMAGPGMRYLEIARQLAAEFDVTLAVPGPVPALHGEIIWAEYSDANHRALRSLVEAHQVALVTPFTLNKHPGLRSVHSCLVVDLYDPFVFENLFYYLGQEAAVQDEFNRRSISILNHAVQLGDFFICGSERQRDFWIGVLTANGRANPATFAQDPSLRHLIDVVGIGFPERPPRSGPYLRGRLPGFSSESRVVLWGGGIWDWLDPLTLLEAWPAVLAQIPQARLVLLGTRPPNPEIPAHRVVSELEDLVASWGPEGESVTFIEWVPYEDREALLSEADVGVVLHPMHVETHFSIRTRVVDYIWARLPVLVSAGDLTSEWVQKYHLGRVVPVGDVNAVAEALVELLSQPKTDWSPAFDRIHDQFTWRAMVAPLWQYCQEPYRAADQTNRHRGASKKSRITNIKRTLSRVKYLYKTQGFCKVLKRVWQFFWSRIQK